MLARETLAYSKLNLVGDSGKFPKDHNADKNTESEDQTQEVSVRDKDSIGSEAWDHLFSLEENLSVFSSCLETLWYTAIKGGKLINLEGSSWLNI